MELVATLDDTSCRVCLNAETKFGKKVQSLFVKHKGCLISKKICSIANVEIKEGDKLPSAICSKCLISLNTAYNFKLTCEKSDKILRSSVNEERNKSGLFTEISHAQCPSTTKILSKFMVKKELNGYEEGMESGFLNYNGEIDTSTHLRVKLEVESQETDQQEQENVRLEREDNMTAHFVKTDVAEKHKNNSLVDNLPFEFNSNKEIGKQNELKATDLQQKQCTDGVTESSHQSNELSQESLSTSDILLSNGKSEDMKCQDCGKSFKSKCKLRVHWKKVHLPEKLICSKCGKKFKSFIAYNKHIKKGKTCVNNTDIRVEGIGKYRVLHCMRCNYSTNRLTNMRTHLRSHPDYRPYICKLCNKGFSQQSTLKGHMESVHKMYQVEMTCPYCGIQVKGRVRVYKHLKKHSSERVQCDICQAVLKNKSSLTQHLKIHEDNKAYSCNQCNAKFNVSAALSQHVRNVHKKEKIFCCDLCPYKTHVKWSLQTHRAKHTATNVTCSVCGSFHENDELLQKHLRLHFSERNFECPHCDKKFLTHRDVGKHVRSIHKCGYHASSRIKKDIVN